MSSSKTWVLSFACVIALSACARSPSTEPAPVKNERRAAASNDMHPAGKPTAPVNIEFKASGKPTMNSSLEIEISVTPTADVDSLIVEIAALDELTVIGGTRELTLDGSSTSTHVERVSVLTGSSDGLLRVTAVTSIGGSEERKVVAYPVTFEGSKAETKPIERTSEGENIIILPADEVTTPRQ